MATIMAKERILCNKEYILHSNHGRTHYTAQHNRHTQAARCTAPFYKSGHVVDTNKVKVSLDSSDMVGIVVNSWVISGDNVYKWVTGVWVLPLIPPRPLVITLDSKQVGRLGHPRHHHY